MHQVWKPFRPHSLPQLCSASPPPSPSLSLFLLSFSPSISCSPFCLPLPVRAPVGTARSSVRSVWETGRTPLQQPARQRKWKILQMGWNDSTCFQSGITCFKNKTRVLRARSLHCYKDRKLTELKKEFFFFKKKRGERNTLEKVRWIWSANVLLLFTLSLISASAPSLDLTRLFSFASFISFSRPSASLCTGHLPVSQWLCLTCQKSVPW